MGRHGDPSPSHGSNHQASLQLTFINIKQSLLNKRGEKESRRGLGVPRRGCRAAPEPWIRNGNVCITLQGQGRCLR